MGDIVRAQADSWMVVPSTTMTNENESKSMSDILLCHPGLEPGSIGQSLERLRSGPRLKAGVTYEKSDVVETMTAWR
jgi:hypothetical protein